MAKLEVVLETVTPVFLAGADNQTPELRPASFRGALRFWLRALLGAELGSDIDRLRLAEGTLFGNTDGASPVTVRISARLPLNKRLKQADERLVVPHSRRFTKRAWAEGGQFVLTLSSRFGQSALPSEAIAAFLLLVNLGGVGNRSRRGFGSLRAIRAKSEALAEGTKVVSFLTKSPQDGRELEEHLAGILAWARGLTSTLGGEPYAEGWTPDYPMLSEQDAKVLVCRHAFAATHYHEAMINFWDRLRKDPYGSRENERAFGHARDGRRASPLLLHIAQSQSGHHLVMTAFRSRPEPIGPRGWRLINDFMEERAAAWDGVFLLGGGEQW